MSFLTRLLSGRTRQVIHPVLGKILLFKAKRGPCWEAEPIVRGEAFSVSVETMDEMPPTDDQVRFYEAWSNDPDAAFAKAAPLLVPEYEKWLRQLFPERWQTAFKFVGMTVPIGGIETNPWELSFDCLTDKSGHMFTCYFEHGHPTSVSIDG